MFKKVLVPLDLQDKQGTAETLAELGPFLTEGGQIFLLTVMPDWQMPLVASYFPKGSQDKARAALLNALDNLAQSQLSGVDVKCMVAIGEAQEQIVQLSKREKADLIVIRAQTHGALDKLMVGSVTAKVVERAPCSVFVLKK
ncbi:universal stress protein [Pontibacter sp. JAM-7]|uniref:universal stress protein n=1 Tax=Pontibacter sp. JAM-7 TaxID=3366581 RepID=UPI003AF81BB8